MFPSDIQLKTTAKEIFVPSGYIMVNICYDIKFRSVKLYLTKKSLKN